MTGVLQVCGAVLAICTAGFALWRVGAAIVHLFQRTNLFLDDWAGTEDRPGVPGRKGVMQRLDVMEHELTMNNGSSIKDGMNRTENALRRVEDTLAAHLEQHRTEATHA